MISEVLVVVFICYSNEVGPYPMSYAVDGTDSPSEQLDKGYELACIRTKQLDIQIEEDRDEVFDNSCKLLGIMQRPD